MNPHYATVAYRAKHRCEYCGAPEVVFNFPFEIEHIVPLARDGADADYNRALACRSCNLYKFTHAEANDPKTGKIFRLFHPRQDQWTQHFAVDRENGSIVGTTAIGRATTIRLKMNSLPQLNARRQWIRLGLFPPDSN